MSRNNNAEMTFQIQRIYIKNISFEVKNAPHFFQKDWKQADIKSNQDTVSTRLTEDVYEVILRVNLAVVALSKETVFLCKVQRGRIFYICGIEDNQITYCLDAYYLNILFPYVSERIASLVYRGTLSQLNFASVNFGALSTNNMQQQLAKKILNNIKDS